ncbi:hypothetical protein E1264_02510 [Actinomadura sp. KC216]|uniref:hypothetical protein n=1 Tax=Actinomadura sp. KC216 TaxID=2530370 RepID=UPI00104D1089|nr:hypothetical protein [Actinomadura sp. KC216]TDB91183.1 hypothetical protein E1264_02510 [Actinomadura sp. KC216]
MLTEDPAVVPVADLVFRSVHVSGFWLPSTCGPSLPRSVPSSVTRSARRPGPVTSRRTWRFPQPEVRDAVQQAGRPGRTGKVLLAS